MVDTAKYTIELKKVTYIAILYGFIMWVLIGGLVIYNSHRYGLIFFYGVVIVWALVLVKYSIDIIRSPRIIVVFSTGEAHIINFLSHCTTIQLADIQEISRKGLTYKLSLSNNANFNVMAVDDFSKFITDAKEANPSLCLKGC